MASQFLSWYDAPRLSAETGDVGKPGGTTSGWLLSSFVRNPKHKALTFSLAPGYSYPAGWSQGGTNNSVVNWNGSATPVARTPMRWSVSAPGEPNVLSPIGWVEALEPAVPLPNPPTNLVATGQSPSEIQLTWTAPTAGSTPVKYRVYHSAGQFGPWTLHDEDLDGSPHTESGLAADTTIWFCVSSVDGNNAESTQSIAAQGSTLPSAPAMPVNVTAEGTSQSNIRISWIDGTNGSTPVAYRIYVSNTGEAGTFSQLVEVGASPYDHGGLAANTTRFYRVRGVNSSGETSGFEQTVSGTTLAEQTPAMPIINIVVALSSSTLQIQYQPGTGGSAPVKYKIYRSSSATGTFNFVADDLDGSPYNDSGRSPSTTYWYRVSAVDSNGAESDQSLAKSGTTNDVPISVTYFWEDGFESATGGGQSDISNPTYNVNATTGASVDLVANPSGSGIVARCRVDRRGDRRASYRAECIPVPGPDFPAWRQEFWAGWALYFEPSWPADRGWLIVNQFKERNAEGSNPAGALGIQNGRMNFTLRKSSEDPVDISTVVSQDLGILGVAFPYGWNYFVVRMVWNWNNSGTIPGQCQLWRNGISVVNYTGACGYNYSVTPNIRGGCYMQRGESAVTGADAIIRTVYFDKIRQAHTSSGGSYAAVDPMQSGL